MCHCGPGKSGLREASEGRVFQASDHRGLAGLCFDECSETKPSKNKMRSEFIKCHYNFDHHETYGKKELKKETLPFRVTEIATGRTTFTGRSWGSRVHANTLATNAVPSAAAEHPIFREARVRTGSAVAVLAGPAALAHALTALTVAVICKTKCSLFLRIKTTFRFLGPIFPLAFKHHQKGWKK